MHRQLSNHTNTRFTHSSFWLDAVQPAFTPVEPTTIYEVVENAPVDGIVQMQMEGENFSGDIVQRTVAIPLGAAAGDGATRLETATGMTMRFDNDTVIVDNVAFDSPAYRWGVDFDWVVLELNRPNNRLAVEWFYIPIYGVLLAIVLLQLARRRRSEEPAHV